MTTAVLQFTLRADDGASTSSGPARGPLPGRGEGGRDRAEGAERPRHPTVPDRRPRPSPVAGAAGDGSPPRIPCELCGKTYAHSRALATHLNQRHPGLGVREVSVLIGRARLGQRSARRA